MRGADPENDPKTSGDLGAATLQTSASILALHNRTRQELLEAKNALEVRTRELAEAVSLLDATLENMADGLFAVDLQGKVMVINQKAIEMLSLPAAVLARKEGAAIADHVAPQTRDPAGYLRRIEELRSDLGREALDVLEFADGRFLERRIQSQRLEGRLSGGVIAYRDVTARERAERMLRLAHAEAERRVAEAEQSRRVLLSVIEDQERSATALRASETNYRTLIESASDAILVSDAQGSLLDVNAAACRMFGYAREELLTMRNTEIVTADEVPRVVPEMARLSVSEVVRSDWLCRRKDGTSFPAEVSATALSDGRMLGILRDVTERKRAEAELNDSRVRLRTIIESEPECVKLLARDGSLQAMNPAGLAMIEADSELQVVGRSIYPIVVPESRAAFQALTESVFEGGSGSLEFEIVGLKGGRRWLDTHAVPLRGPDRAVQAVLGLTRDVTERKRAEERYRRFFEEDLAGAFVTTPDGRILECNPAFARIFGFASPDEARTHGALSLYPDAEARRSLLERLRVQGKISGEEVELRRRDGSAVHLIENIVASFDATGELVELTGYLFDVSERKKAEDQLRQSQKIEAIGQLAGGVAHDFNNILGVITGYGELALRQLGPDHPVRARVDQILKAAARAAGLTRQLLAFSRKQIMHPQPLDLNTIVTDVEKMLGRLIREDIDVVVHAAPGLGTVKADAGQVEQVILNLAVNARDAMPMGGSLTLETANVDLDEEYAAAHPPLAAGRYVMLAVSDTGIGMDEETQRRIFEPFFTTKPEGQGTGLGLATVYGIVKQSGGYIWVHSQPGRGTTFKVYLPRVNEAEQAVRPAGSAAEAQQGQETILLVEDTETLREVIREMLEELGYTVLSASNGENALALARARQGPIDLLLTDVVMPKLGGGDLGKLLAASRPEIRVLYMSGYTDGVISHHGVLGEGVMLLEKPFTGDRLARVVREALDRPDPRG